MTNDSTTRFSNRVDDYVKYRPGYPEEIIPWLQSQFRFPAGKTIADIGAGTGISSRLFLRAGYHVIGIEPNREMREMAVRQLSEFQNFAVLDGRAESTGLPANAVDAIVAGQAFHWFETATSKTEFKRVLRKDGLLVLIWNERLTASLFEQDYDNLIIKHGRSYKQVDHRNISPEIIAAFFHPQPYEFKIFPNEQVFDFSGLKGRLLSSSYMPAMGEKGYDAMIDHLQQLFDQFQENGTITINYSTKIFAGIL